VQNFLWHVTGERRGAYRSSIGRPKGKRLLGRPRRRKDNMKMSSRSRMGRHGVDLSGSGHREVPGACECDKEASGSIKCGHFLV